MSFKQYLEALHLAPNTVDRYVAWERSFLRYLDGQTIEQIGSKELLLYLKSKQVKRSTAVHLLARLKHYYRYVGLDFPLGKMQLKGYDQSEKAPFLSPQQLEQIVHAYQQNKRLALVSQAVIQLLVYQGINTHELRLLEVQHLDLLKGVISIPADQLASRILPLAACQILSLAQLIQGKEQGDSLLNYQGDSHLQNRHQHWKLQIKKELKKQEFKIPFENLQQLRNSRIALWIKEHGILKAQYLAGHTSIVSTQLYQQLDYEQLRTSFQAAHPFYKNKD